MPEGKGKRSLDEFFKGNAEETTAPDNKRSKKSKKDDVDEQKEKMDENQTKNDFSKWDKPTVFESDLQAFLNDIEKSRESYANTPMKYQFEMTRIKPKTDVSQGPIKEDYSFVVCLFYLILFFYGDWKQFEKYTSDLTFLCFANGL